MIIENDRVYKTIPEFENYMVSNKGDVISKERKVFTGSGVKRRQIILKQKKLKLGEKDGYFYVNLRKNNKTYGIGVHRLVLWAFVGKQPKGIEVRHLNSNPSDNRLENLKYGTKSDNMQDAVELGTLVFSRSKLTLKDVQDIAKATGTLNEIAKRFNCGAGTVQAIKTKKSFKDFSGEVVYKRRKRVKLSDESLQRIRDRNIRRKQLCKEFNITLEQLKRIRTGFDNIFISE